MHGRLRDEVHSRDDSPTCLDTVLGCMLEQIPRNDFGELNYSYEIAENKDNESNPKSNFYQ